MTTTTSNTSEFDNVSTTPIDGSVCSGDCVEPQDPELQEFLRVQRTLVFLADESPLFTRARVLTIAESETAGETRMEGILQDFDWKFDSASNKPRL